jgi:hypothetical protein
VLNQPAPAELQRTGAGTRGGRARTDDTNSSAGQAQRSAAAARAASAVEAPVARTTASKATTIDALFAPIAPSESRGMVWQYDSNKQLKAVRLRLGATDGTFTEVLNEADVSAEAQIVTAMKTGLEQNTRTATTTQNGNPLMGGGPPGGRGAPGGGRGF